MTGIQSFTFQAGYGWLLSHKWDHPSYDTTTNSSEGGSGFFNVGVDLGLFIILLAAIEFGRLYTT